MNTYIDAQIANIIAMVKTFEHSCIMAATKDDGRINREEGKELKKIKSATSRFIKDLEAMR